MLTPALHDGTALDHAWIAAHIPHQGRMCLLDRVLAWDAQHIVCNASSHRNTDHPLRQFDRLGAACGIEYAAQAMAVHGALVASRDEPPRPGMLVSVRAVQLHATRLDDIDADLAVHAERLSGDARMLLYQFRVRAADRLLLDGRASVLLGSA
ncbi:MAG: 3-hydroxylacyl-ACP dehydratase [Thiomonas sp. 20-64-5]|nr:MAG: 3-hydroxylacyl-ACP dehydratase [Thiomonas sp. 20-64-5]